MQFEQASAFEKKIKKWSRGKKLALANEEFDRLKILAECKNETHAKNSQEPPLDSARGNSSI